MSEHWRTVYEKTRDFLDSAVKDLPRDNYKEFLEELAGEIECRLDCIKEEDEVDEH